jgi:hypothetical protein
MINQFIYAASNTGRTLQNQPHSREEDFVMEQAPICDNDGSNLTRSKLKRHSSGKYIAEVNVNIAD